MKSPTDMPPDPNAYTPAELGELVDRMAKCVRAIYPPMAACGVHPFVEFNGVMFKYVDLCRELARTGVQFPFASIHSSAAVPIDDHHLVYLFEKLGCIFAPFLRGNPRARQILLEQMFGSSAGPADVFQRSYFCVEMQGYNCAAFDSDYEAAVWAELKFISGMPLTGGRAPKELPEHIKIVERALIDTLVRDAQRNVESTSTYGDGSTWPWYLHLEPSTDPHDARFPDQRFMLGLSDDALDVGYGEGWSGKPGDIDGWAADRVNAFAWRLHAEILRRAQLDEPRIRRSERERWAAAMRADANDFEKGDRERSLWAIASYGWARRLDNNEPRELVGRDRQELQLVDVYTAIENEDLDVIRCGAVDEPWHVSNDDTFGDGHSLVAAYASFKVSNPASGEQVQGGASDPSVSGDDAHVPAAAAGEETARLELDSPVKIEANTIRVSLTGIASTPPERPEWCEMCREYKPCSGCTHQMCTMGCGRPLPYYELVAAVQRGNAMPDQRYCWGSPECEDTRVLEREQAARQNHLVWNGSEWVDDRCGCRYHPDDDRGTHGGAPHVHRCDGHLATDKPVLVSVHVYADGSHTYSTSPNVLDVAIIRALTALARTWASANTADPSAAARDVLERAARDLENQS